MGILESQNASEGRSPQRGVVNVLGCYIVVSEFERQSRYKVHFQTNTLAKDLNSLYPQQ